MSQSIYLSNKSSEMQNFLDQMSKEIFGKSRRTGQCVGCDNPKILTRADFRDNLSRKEFSISRFCQKCQDEVFGA